MNTPTFFAWDNFSQYSDGTVSSLNKQVSWAGSGTFVGTPVITPRDNFESYPDGSIEFLTNGFDWQADGLFTVYP